MLGGCVKAFGSASAPLLEQVQEFLKISCCVPIFSAYGSTENTASGIITSVYENQTLGIVGGPS